MNDYNTSWHRRFAWLPTGIDGGVTVWLGFYEIRYVKGPPAGAPESLGAIGHWQTRVAERPGAWAGHSVADPERCDEGPGRPISERAARYLPHCYQCLAALQPNDDANVCVQCGGMSLRAYPRHCCKQCGEPLGYLVLARERIFGRVHECNDRKVSLARMFRCSTGGRDLVKHKPQ